MDASYDSIMTAIETCELGTVQLHGNETPEMVTQIQSAGDVVVIKALFEKKAPDFSTAGIFNPNAFLVECGQGVLPGGNAKTWNWASAATLNANKPVILAGGLTPDNVVAAATVARPGAIDISSGVEKTPGRKDLNRVKQLITTVKTKLCYKHPHELIFVSKK